MNEKELEQLLHLEIPITQALGISVLKLDEQRIEVSAPFENNKNIHNTAFAGSIYTTATLAAWSLMTNFAKLKDLQGAVVLAKGEIKYLKPINGDIVAHSALPESSDIESFITQLENKNSGRMTLKVLVKEDGVSKARFIGQFAFIKQS